MFCEKDLDLLRDVFCEGGGVKWVTLKICIDFKHILFCFLGLLILSKAIIII